MNRHLHIVCLDAPWPADYGGAIDMFYKIGALYQAGIKIHLHYFSYNQRGNPTELNQYCESINVYERKTGYKGFSWKLPYIVASRINDELGANLNKDDHPVLLEGIHCTGILPRLEHNRRKIVVRMHNVESEYYKQLAGSSAGLFKKIYFKNESRLLKKYERTLPQHCLYACISTQDTVSFRDHYGLKNVFLLPAFTSYSEVKSEEGMGSFCLYHANLSVPENEKAAAWLVKNVFSKIKVPLVVAGKNPSRRLKKIVQLYRQSSLVSNPSDTEINELVKKAHINILPSCSSTGTKIKLLHALFEGRHCLVNDAMIAGTGLEAACHTGTNANAFASIIMQLYHQPFTADEITIRRNLMGTTYDNKKNIQLLIQYLW